MCGKLHKNCLKLRTNFRKIFPHVHKFSVHVSPPMNIVVDSLSSSRQEGDTQNKAAT